jgi:transposase
MDSRLVLGPVGKKIYLIRNSSLKFTMTLTAITDISDESARCLFCGTNIDSNTSDDFVMFMVKAIEAGQLRKDDCIIMDNSLVHVCENNLNILQDLFQTYGISMMLLPTYSPELSPVELVFGWLKNYLQNRSESENVIWELIQAISKFEKRVLERFYYRCLSLQ